MEVIDLMDEENSSVITRQDTRREIQLVDAINLLEGSSPVKYFQIGFFNIKEKLFFHCF